MDGESNARKAVQQESGKRIELSILMKILPSRTRFVSYKKHVDENLLRNSFTPYVSFMYCAIVKQRSDELEIWQT
jgi:hypothetical protein